MTKITHDYLNLRKNLALYIDKYPSATRDSNKINLEQLNTLKKTKDICPDDLKKYNKIRDEITISNGGFAMTYVMKYSNVLNDCTPVSELFQEATIGIIESIDTFDLSKNTSFTTYAFYHIRKRLVDYIKKNKLIKAPRDIARNIKHVNKMQEKLFSRNGKVPTAYDIQQAIIKEKSIEIKEETVDKILILLELNSAGYEDTFVSEYVDQLSCEDHESSLFRAIELNILASLKRYTPQQQRMIKLRFGIAEEYPHTIEEIKLMLGLTEEDIKQI